MNVIVAAAKEWVSKRIFFLPIVAVLWAFIMAALSIKGHPLFSSFQSIPCI